MPDHISKHVKLDINHFEHTTIFTPWQTISSLGCRSWNYVQSWKGIFFRDKSSHGKYRYLLRRRKVILSQSDVTCVSFIPTTVHQNLDMGCTVLKQFADCSEHGAAWKAHGTVFRGWCSERFSQLSYQGSDIFVQRMLYANTSGDHVISWFAAYKTTVVETRGKSHCV